MKKLTALCLTVATPLIAADFRPIFNGVNLDGWNSPDMSYWSVQDGAIVAQCSPEHPCKKNQFLVWQRGDIDNFELKLKFKIEGQPNSNSGIQIRSQIAPDGHALGYQCDIDRQGNWLGALYDEHTGRRVLAKRGQKTTIAANGARKTQQISDPAALKKNIDIDAWNEYHITAIGPHITLKINNVVTAEVIDEETAHQDLLGKLALQLHSGPPMKIQFKDIMLKRLPMNEGTKKIVLIAGAPSHRSGDHEHNAGIKLLTKRLNKIDGVVAVSYHDRGWPKDASAFDNADGIVVYSDGGGGHPINQRLKEVDELMGKGIGLMCMHYAVEVPADPTGKYFKQWIGGYYESGWSINPHWLLRDTTLAKGFQGAAGVEPWQAVDEWYYNMRFRENTDGLIRILQARPDDEARSGSTSWPRGPKKHIVDSSGRMETIMWAVEREDGGRGVGFTGGHFHKNWANDQQRNLILNTMVWMAGGEVPKGGVKSEPVSEDEINANLDPKKNMQRIKL